MSENELKPCPFCGQEPKEHQGSINCLNPDCLLIEVVFDDLQNGSRDNAIKKWNTRPVVNILEAENDELRSMFIERGEIIEQKQARIKELDEQVQELQKFVDTLWSLKISKRWQARALRRAYENWLYSRYQQMGSQLKLEILRLMSENKKLTERLTEAYKENDEILNAWDESLNELQNSLVENTDKEVLK